MRCSAMRILLVMGAFFIVINISFLYLQTISHSAGTVCDCERSGMNEGVPPMASVVSSEAVKTSMVVHSEAKTVVLSPAKASAAPSEAEDFKKFTSLPKLTGKPVFNEVIRPNFGDKVKPPKHVDMSKVNAVSTARGYDWNETYQPLHLRSSSHKLAVVVPFRNRYEEMLEFVPHMHRFLTRQNVSHEFWIINQVDSHRFNRAALLNIGFLLSRKECDYIVMHDIDLLPLNDDLLYKFPLDGPLHISAPELHPLYHYRTFIGGILIMSRDQFQQVDGISNIFWGWGREDDELYVRIQEANMKVHYPQGITTGYSTFKHNHDKQKRPRDQKKTRKQQEMSNKRDRYTGVSTVQFKLVSKTEMTISGIPFNFVSVAVACDHDLTPYCDNPS